MKKQKILFLLLLMLILILSAAACKSESGFWKSCGGNQGGTCDCEEAPGGGMSDITIGKNGNWFINGVDSGVKAEGKEGAQGPAGPAGPEGQDGTDGSPEMYKVLAADTLVIPVSDIMYIRLIGSAPSYTFTIKFIDINGDSMDSPWTDSYIPMGVYTVDIILGGGTWRAVWQTTATLTGSGTLSPDVVGIQIAGHGVTSGYYYVIVFEGEL